MLSDGTKPFPEPMMNLNEVYWHLAEENFTETVLNVTHYKVSENYKFENTATGANEFTHCGLVTPYGGMDLGQHWFR